MTYFIHYLRLSWLLFIAYCMFPFEVAFAQPQSQGWLDVERLAMPAQTLVLTQKKLLGMGVNDDLRPTRIAQTDDLGYTHHRYQQIFKGIAVENAVLLVHERNGMAYLANGNVLRNLQGDATPNLAPEQALQRALAHIGATKYAWQDPQYEAIIKEIENKPEATYYPSGELVWVAPTLTNNDAQTYRLAYKFDVYAIAPLKRAYIYIDAQDGKLVAEQNQLHDVDIAATGNDAYSCSNPVNITADNVGGFNRLRETQRGGGIETYTAMNSDSYPLFDITDTDTYFNNDPTAVSAHRCTEATYDYFKNTFNRNSIDGNGYKLKSWVHYGIDEQNAYWNGTFMTYGDGGSLFSAFTSPDVVAHEITHGLTQFEANLVYAYEPGALNESFSDIFGTVIEHQANPSCADWIIGSDIALTTNGLRSMSNPNDATMYTQCPDTYGGTHWITNSDDWGGVHTNSGVQNFWFYLLSNGGSGTNDNNTPYTVTGIGMNKAARIAYRNLTVYLTPTSQYLNARAGAIQAATDLYGANSNEVAQVIAAWCAVGVGNCTAANNSLTLTAPNGGEIWQYGSTQNITWTTTGTVPTVNIDYTIDGGATWNNIAANVSNTGNMAWEVPNASSSQAKMRVSAALNAGLQDMSDATFTIQGCDVVASFITPTNICPNIAQTFINTSGGTGGFSYTWQIDGTNVGNAPNLSYTFANAGNFTVALTVSNGLCSDTYTRTITVNPTADASFTHTESDLTANVYAVQNGATTYNWDFGDGSTATTQNAVHTYSTAGTYNVCLTVENGCGIANSCQSVVVSVNCADEWNVYDIPTNGIRSELGIDAQGNKWVGTHELARFDGSNWVSYTQSNSGMPANSGIEAITIDNQDNKWIGTIGGGLVKFDNTNWTVYNTSNSGLGDNWVLAIAIDAQNNKWIGTNSGLAKFDGTSWVVYNATNCPAFQYGVNAIDIDAQGNKWIGTGLGLVKFDGTTWITYNITNSPLPANHIRAIEIDLQGNKWIGTGLGGVAKFDDTNWTIYNTTNSALLTNDAYDLDIDAQGTVWVTCWDTNYSGDGGLVKFDGTNWNAYTTANSGLNYNGPYAIEVDNNGNKWLLAGGKLVNMGSCEPLSIDCQENWIQYTKSEFVWDSEIEGNTLWLATYVGLVELNMLNGNSIFYNNANSSLPLNDIRAIVIDLQGNKWIGTYGGGVVKFDGSNWTVYNTSNSGLLNDFIKAIVVDANNGDIWVGSNGGGLVKFDGSNWTVYNTTNSGLANNTIRTIAIDNIGNKWIGTNGGGISKFDGSTWITYNTSNSGLPNNTVHTIAIDQQGNKWIGYYGNVCLTKFDGTTWTNYTNGNSGLPNNYVRTIAVDAQNNKWIGLANGAMAKFDGISWTTYNDPAVIGANNNHIISIVIDDSGNKWVGTESGSLAKFDNTNWTMLNTNVANSPLPHNNINVIAIDINGDRWVATDNGLAKFDGINWTVYNSANSGLPSNNIAAMVIDAQGNKWIGTGNGLSKFDNTNWVFYDPITAYGAGTSYVTSIAIDNNNNKWIGTGSSGINFAKFNDAIWESYSLPISPDKIAIDNNNNKWITSLYNGMVKFDSNNNITSYNVSNSLLPSNLIREIKIDIESNIWIGTADAGIAKFNETNWTIYNSSNSGLPTVFVSAIDCDTEGNKWFGTSSGGLVKFDDVNWIIYNNTNSGISDNYIDAISINNSGEIWAGGFYQGISVLSNGVTASFTTPTTPTCATTPLTFTNTSAGATAYQWSVNGVVLATTTHFTHNFAAAGTYTITLEAANGTCSDTYSQTITINANALNLEVPDVAICGTSALLDCGIADALYYLWDLNGTLVGNTQSISVTQSGIYTLSVADACGNVGFDSQINVLLDDNCVWSGDFNYDGIANNYDLLHWGWASGHSGAVRPNASYTWQAQPCSDWANSQQDGTNYKHADGNGNGIIDNNDPQAIISNYGQTHGIAPAVNNTASPLSITAVVNQMPTAIGNHTFLYIDLYLNNNDNASTTLYGAAFKVDYLFPSAFHIHNAYIDFSSSWLGSDGVNMRSVQKNFINSNDNGGYIEVAVSRNDHQNATGSSKVATLIAEIDVVNSGGAMQAFVSATNAQVSLANGNIMGISNSNNMSFSLSPSTAPTGLILQPTVWLNGAYNVATSQMKTTLRSNNLLPLQQPYNISPYNYFGTEMFANITNMPSNAVDWVLVELRSASNIQQNVVRKAALLLSNGSVVDIDGVTNGLRFPTVAAGNYYVVIRHRNHIDIVSNNTVNLSNGIISSLDLGNASNVMGGVAQVTALANGKYALKGGDFDHNGIINVSDFNLFSSQAATINQYNAADCNFDGNVTTNDFNVYMSNPSAVGVGLIRY